ncbi:helix-turn-helix transcriptional regulator [Halobacteria archaeon AArc-dxtr1]|nr:helix-turn-helix transcriptional regulator [Halobacteria archaeon AArc-dxtr1]
MARGGCRNCGARTTKPRLCKQCQRLERQGFFADSGSASDSQSQTQELECTDCGEIYRGTTASECPTCGATRCRYVGPLPGEDKEIIADGGMSWTDLTGFQRDCLEAIARVERGDETCYGLAIKRRLESTRGEEINHGRLYPNLDTLVDLDFVEKSTLDRRTNEYRLTDSARAVLIQRAERLADAAELHAVGGGQT